MIKSPSIQRVVDLLQETNALCSIKRQVKEIAEVVAKWPTGQRWRILIKSTADVGVTPEWPSTAEISDIKAKAEGQNEQPVIAWVYANNCVDFYLATNGSHLDPPKLK